MRLVLEFATHHNGRRVELWRLARVGDSVAESAYRVKVSGRTVHKGWSQDSYEEYKRLTTDDESWSEGEWAP